MEEVKEIAIEHIDRNPDQPRQFFDPAGVAELAASIEANGLLQPLVVRPAGDRYVIIAGERRWRAIQSTDLTAVPCSVIATITDEAAYMLSVAENVNRRDMTIMEEARAYAKVMGFGKTVAEVAERFGKTTAHISWRLGYLTLTDASAGALDAGFIGTEFAYYVAKLNPANQAVAIRRYIKGEFTTEGGAHAFAHALLVAEQQGPGFFEVAELTDDERAEKRTATRKARGDIDQIERAQGLLDDLAHKTPAELADLFETEVGSQLDKLDRLHAALMAARKQMRKARGISEARVYAVRDEVTAVAA